MKSISVEALRERVEKGEAVNLLDVREPAEYEAYHLGGQLIPLSQVIHWGLEEGSEKKDEEWIIHCKSGKRSMQACLYLEQAGFTHVVNLEGGADAWKAAYGEAKVVSP